MGDLSRTAAVRALERLIELLENPDTPNADVLKASQLIFDRIYAQADAPQSGDFDIIVKEE